jgi:hypothetical protein
MKSLFRYKILTLLAGIATAAVIIFSQLFYFQAATYCQEKVDTEQNDQKAGATESYISIPSSTISSTSNIVINQDLNFVLEILFEREPDEESNTVVSLSVNRFFQTLFRFIISPNAP